MLLIGGAMLIVLYLAAVLRFVLNLCQVIQTGYVRWSHILIDTNGLKGPNIAGRDVFFIAYYEDGTIDEEGVSPVCNSMKVCHVPDNAEELRQNLYNNSCFSSSRFRGCFGKILNDGWEMNY